MTAASGAESTGRWTTFRRLIFQLRAREQEAHRIKAQLCQSQGQRRSTQGLLSSTARFFWTRFGHSLRKCTQRRKAPRAKHSRRFGFVIARTGICIGDLGLQTRCSSLRRQIRRATRSRRRCPQLASSVSSPKSAPAVRWRGEAGPRNPAVRGSLQANPAASANLDRRLRADPPLQLRPR